jgi:hypothetical protein
VKSLALVLLAVAACPAADVVEAFGHQWSVAFAGDWRVDQEDGVPVLRLVRARGPEPGPTRPVQFALHEAPLAGRVRFEADVEPLGGSLLVVFAYRDAAHFCYAHLSKDWAARQPFHNGIFRVSGGPRERVSGLDGPAAFAASGRWYHVSLSYDTAAGAVSVVVDGVPLPSLSAIDARFGTGRFGIGSFDETASFKNVKIIATPGSGH